MGRYWKKLFSILAFVCLYSSNIFSENIAYKVQNDVLLQTIQIETTFIEDFKSDAPIVHHYIAGHDNEFSARSRRSTITSSRIIILPQKPISFSVPLLVQAMKKAPISIEFHECAIKLNDCSRIIHLFYLF